jgi:hypothetical protein
MKFRQFLQEEVSREEIEDWFRLWTKGAHHEFNQWLKDGKIDPKWVAVDVWAVDPNQIFNPPMPTSWWPDFRDFSITTEWGNARASSIIPDFQKMPNSETILLSGISIESFKGIEKLSRFESLEIGSGKCEIKCGLLTLLKSPTLDKVWVDSEVKMNPDLFAAIRIVNNHLKSKDVADCMDELIEAGLKEYAKL